MERFWELDSVRGLSVVFMVLFNWSYALHFLEIYSIFPDASTLYWSFFPKTIAGSFMLIAGISLSLSWNRFSETDPSEKEKWKKYVFRGLKIIGLGLGITAVTWLTFPDYFVFFGILHLLGLSIALSPLVISDPGKALILSGFVLAIFLFPENSSSSVILSSIGVVNPSLNSLDYFPFIPWSAVVFFGIAVGHKVFPGSDRRFEVERPEKNNLGRLSDFLELMGRNSLKIYLLHQPLLLSILMLLGYQVL